MQPVMMAPGMAPMMQQPPMMMMGPSTLDHELAGDELSVSYLIQLRKMNVTPLAVYSVQWTFSKRCGRR